MDFKTIELEKAYQDYRLDKTLLSLFPWLSFGECQQLLRKKLVKLNDKKAQSNIRISAGDKLTYPEFILAKSVPSEQKNTAAFEKYIQPNIVFEDDFLLIINKPQGLAVQGGSKTKQHVDQILKAYYQADAHTTPLLVHRLDQATSGILIIAKNKITASKMGALFKTKNDIQKTYIACCWGEVPKKLIEISFPIEQKRIQSVERMHFSETGQDALTNIHLLKTDHEKSWISLMPITGRKHQLRAHLAMIGYPIIGDQKYNINICLIKNLSSKHTPSTHPFEPQFKDDSKNLYLHAYKIKFKHPITEKMVDIHAPLPEHMKEIQSKL